MRSKEDESFDHIQRLGRYRGEVLVAGCLPEIAKKRFQRDFKGRFVSTKHIEDLDKLFPDFEVKLSQVEDPHLPPPVTPFEYSIAVGFKPPFGLPEHCTLAELAAWAWRGKTRLRRPARADTEAFLRVGYGCVGGCSYCAIQRAIGRLRSKSLNRCVREYETLLAEGFRWIVLVSDNIGAYGLDRAASFDALLHRLLTLEAPPTVRWDIRQMAPKYVIRYREALEEAVRAGLLVSLHAPVQSGSAGILKKMNRDTDIPGFVETLKSLHRIRPDLVLNTEVIIGFPCETETDFSNTLEVLGSVPFRQVSLFPYSDVEGTPASGYTGKVDRTVILDRVGRAREFLRKRGVEVFCSVE